MLPPSVMGELAKLQDKIEPFSTVEARAAVERELGAPIDELFSEFSAEPVAAASLAQVRRGPLQGGGAGRRLLMRRAVAAEGGTCSAHAGLRGCA